MNEHNLQLVNDLQTAISSIGKDIQSIYTRLDKIEKSIKTKGEQK